MYELAKQPFVFLHQCHDLLSSHIQEANIDKTMLEYLCFEKIFVSDIQSTE